MNLATISQLSWLALLALASSVVAAVILLWFLLRKPKLGPGVKIALLFGIGLFPILAAFTGNLAGYQKTMDRSFCGSCHTMEPYVADSNNPKSTSLAAIHARNELFGAQNCYTCHADYGMFGTISTKLAGMRHVYEYYGKYRSMPINQFLVVVEIYRKYPNANCNHCHSMTTPGFNDVPEHLSAADLLKRGELSCASEGCHGPAHPFSKNAKAEAAGG